MKILITGFERFNQSPVNPSEQLVQAISSYDIPGAEITGATLPVDSNTAPPALTRLLEETNFDAVICLGEARGRTAISLERVGINLLDFRIPDNAGNSIIDQLVIPGGPDAYFTTLPVRKLMEAVQQAGIPAELSLSAGSYLCNQITYTLLHTLKKAGRSIPAGFIHLPSLPEQIIDKARTPSMSLNTMQQALEIILIKIVEITTGARNDG